MTHISIISSSVRQGRKSDRVALFFQNYLQTNKLAATELIDLNVYQFPIFEERLRFQKNPEAKAIEISEKINSTDGVIIVTPEYNGGYPASLKNVIDLLYDEWKRKPTAIATVSSGSFGGMQVITSLQFSLWKMHAWTVPALFPVGNINETFDEKGNPNDKETIEKRAKTFVDELLWCIKAKKYMDSQ